MAPATPLVPLLGTGGSMVRQRCVVRLDQTHAIVGVVCGRAAVDSIDARAESLRQVYAGAFSGGLTARSFVLRSAHCGVAIVTCDPIPELRSGDRIVFGYGATDSSGPLSDAAVDELIAKPQRARAVAGSFVIVGLEDSCLSIIVSASLPHVISRVDGPDGTAIATRGLAAHILAGRRPEISEAAVGDLLAFDYVLGDGTLLTGTSVLEEATWYDISSEIRSGSYWPREERLSPDEPVTIPTFLDDVTQAVARLCGAQCVHLGLTAGRDSTLLAAVIQRAGLDVPTYTWGARGHSETDTAIATAARLGLQHKVLAGRRDIGVDAFEHLIDVAPWHEGLERARDFTPGHVDWPSHRLWWITGNGGELGRAYYWSTAPEAALLDPVRWLVRKAATMPRRRRSTLRERLENEFDKIRRIGRPRSDDLDVFYAVERMRKWLPHVPPNEALSGLLAAYLEPAVVRSLLAIPLDERRTGAFFDRALYKVFPGDARSVDIPTTPSRRARAMIRRLHARSNLSWPPARRTIGGLEGGLAEEMIAASLRRGSFTRSVMGRRWFDAEIERVRRGHDVRALWNALSIDAFADRIHNAP